MVFGGTGVGYDNIELSVAKVAKCMFRKNNKFTLVFDLSVAEVAEVAGFLGVRGDGFDNNNIYA